MIYHVLTKEVNLEQHKKVTKLENSWTMYDLIDQELECLDTRHYLDRCPDITPERFNEIVLEIIEQLKQDTIAWNYRKGG